MGYAVCLFSNTWESCFSNLYLGIVKSIISGEEKFFSEVKRNEEIASEEKGELQRFEILLVVLFIMWMACMINLCCCI